MELSLESKHADIQAHRGDDFHFAWELEDGTILGVEYIPDNWPSLTVRTTKKDTISKRVKRLEEVGFDLKRG